MRFTIAVFAAVALVFFVTPSSASFSLFPFGLGLSDANGGTQCAGCTVIVSLVEQLASIHNETVDATVAKLCDLFPPGPVQTACQALVEEYGPAVINRLEAKDTPDVVCHAINFCTGTCQLFPQPQPEFEAAVKRAKAAVKVRGLPSFCNLPAFEELCNLINNFANNHLPIDDLDGDDYSTMHTFRGSYWRGKDCNDHAAAFHPGAIPIDWDVEEDSNCNGILGTNPDTGVPYELEYCGNSTARGVAILGDSAAAHFHIPPEYFEPATWTDTTFQNILTIVEDEFDWPLFSWATGFMNTSIYNPEIVGPVNSTYMYYNGRNRCNHRDFQNIGVNGARSGDMNSTVVYGLKRNQASDKPMLVFLALIGNDVCNGHPDTVGSMTTTTEMYANTMGSLHHLETVLPAGSDVVLMGLADGRVLYEALANRTHPLGMYRNNLNYTTLYTYLNCLQISPCSGWMNSNATLRNLTSERAANLSQVLQGIAETQTFNNFNLHYIDCPIMQALANWQAAGGEAWELIEPVDGFHPNQIAMSMEAGLVIDWATQNLPYLFGDVNPFNDVITEQFGNQGGY